jgi:PAP2 superfamily
MRFAAPTVQTRTVSAGRSVPLAHRLRMPWRELALVALAGLAYFAIRNVTVGSAHDAFENGRSLVHVEETLHLDWEERVQDEVTPRDWLVVLVNWVYIWGHWPVIITSAILLYRHRRDRYYLLRNAMFVSAAVGFTFFILFPVAPPRLLELGLVDTVTEESNAYRALQPPGLTNQYAAFPSLHAGWNVLLGIAVYGVTASVVVRALAVLGPAAMVFAVVATANHFVVDVAGGVAAVLVGLAAAHYAGPPVARLTRSARERGKERRRPRAGYA